MIGNYYNNGKKCVRDRVIMSRDIVPATCPDEFEYRAGKCRKKHEKNTPPQCPDNYQRQGSQCYSKCPAPYRTTQSDCLLGRATLDPRYMTCPEGMHRYNAYCCTPGVDCPQIECVVGEDVPGKFYYDGNGICERQPQAVARTTILRKNIRTSQFRGRNDDPDYDPLDPNRHCPGDKVLVWGVCQDKCPDEYQAMKGKCVLRRCSFDATTDNIVECPEGTYVVTKAQI